MKKHNAFTLIEMLTSSAVGLLIAALVASTLILSLRYWKLIDIKSEVQLNSMIGIESIKNEALYSNIGSFTVNMNNYPKAVSFQSAYYNNFFHTTSDGAPSWQTYVIYYVLSGSTDLVRKEIYSPGPLAALSPEALISYCTSGGAVKALDINDFSASIGSNYVNISIKTRLDYANKENSTNITSRIYPRN